MIRKITDPKIYLSALNGLEKLFSAENKSYGHQLQISKKRLSEFADKNTLTWHWHVWVSEQDNTYDGLLIFSGYDHPLFEEKVAVEVLWLSKGNSGIKMLKQSLDWLRSNGYSHYIMGRVNNYPKSERLTKVFEKFGLTKDGESFIGKT